MNAPKETEVPVKQVVVRDNLVPAEVGRDVLYVLSAADSPPNAGQVRPAKIVALIDDGSGHGLVNLQVFTNGGFDQLPNVHHAKNVVHDENSYSEEEQQKGSGHGTWRWPPPRELVFRSQTRPLTADELDELEESHPDVPADPNTGTIDLASLKDPYHVGEAPPGFEKNAEVPPPAPTEQLPFSEEPKA